ncbi:MAG: arylmalonate decarboxylase [Pseudomonadota bacterium]|nr:arylmalonate decarboxylase [Pseudomonadota bacterium]
MEMRHKDALGSRRKIGVVVPATNTIVEPEFHQMAPSGVSNHTNRFQLSNMSLQSDADFLRLVEEIKENLDQAIDGLVPAALDHIIIGISAESFWDGAEGADAIKDRLSDRAGVSITLGSDAARHAIRAVGAHHLAVLTPYWPVADERVRHYFGQCGFEVRRLIGLKATSPINIAEQDNATLTQALYDLDGDDIDAIVQVGTNLSMVRLAANQEKIIGKPVIAINTALYWHALRSIGVEDQMPQFGQLLELF